ncbi:MAG: prepilin-type N-terminal cleavage/methylation domain-containing protein [Planctomycetes bacterium]|nr:prepilin-type N-terminal cleavage/methylation domain-containing protein [Planctomycetota bacterium]
MKTMRSRRADAAGFSLVELMIAVTVILFGLLTAYSSELSSLEVVKTSRETNTAMADLQACMESLLVLPPAEIPNPEGPYAPGQIVEAFRDLHLENQRIVATYPNLVTGQPVPDPLEIVLTMTWTDRQGRGRELRISSVKTR